MVSAEIRGLEDRRRRRDERLCEELEDHGRVGRADACEPLVTRLQAAYEPVAAALQRQLA